MTTPQYFADDIDKDEIAGRIPSQWENAVRLNALLNGILDLAQRELVEPLRQLEAYQSLDNAEGVWLDRLAAAVECGRPFLSVAAVAGSYFNFGTRFGLPGISISASPIGDADMRGFAAMCARMLYGDVTLGSLQWQARGMFPGAVYTEEAGRVAVDLNAEGGLILAGHELGGRLPRAPGLPLSVTV